MHPAGQSDAATDLTCWRCGYNLRGRGPSDRCSECGELVARSLSPFGPTADPVWLLRLERGAELIALSGLLWALGRSAYCWRWAVIGLTMAALAAGVVLFTRPSVFANPFRQPTRVLVCVAILLFFLPSWFIKPYVMHNWLDQVILLIAQLSFATFVIASCGTARYYLKRACTGGWLVAALWVLAITIAIDFVCFFELVTMLAFRSMSPLTWNPTAIPLGIVNAISTWFPYGVAALAYWLARTIRAARSRIEVRNAR